MVPVPFDRPRRHDDPEYGRLTASILDTLDAAISGEGYGNDDGPEAQD